MAQPNTVEIFEVCKVAPPLPADSTAPKSLPLTFFDMRWLKLPPIQRLFFYEIPVENPNTTLFFHSNIVPRLKQSLSLTLQHYLPLAGNLTWPPTSPKPLVDYATGDAVSLTVAKSNADFYQLSSKDILSEAGACYHLAPDLPVSHEQAAVLAIQVTEFPNGCFSVGISMHHAVLDGKTLHLFLKSWVHICRSLGSGEISLPSELKPSYDRTFIKDPANLEANFAEQWLSLHGPDNRSLLPLDLGVQKDLIRGTFEFPPEKIKKLRQLLSSEMMSKYKNDQQVGDHDHLVQYISTFSLISAYTWVCLVKAEGNKDEKIPFVFPVDCRSRLEPPPPATYFGNCVGSRYVVMEREVLVGEHGFVKAVKAFSEAVKSLKSGVLNGAENWVSPIVSMFQNSGSPEKKTAARRVYSVTGSPRFQSYGSADFGWGRPKKVTMLAVDRGGGISLCDNSDGNGGVEIGVALKKAHMEAFASSFAEGLESL